MGRIIIFTGKGGVGKSSIAAAHGVKAAKEGKKTIIVSTDMAHNLGDIFNINMTSEPVKIMENLSLLEIDPHSEIDGEYRSLVDTIITAFMGSGEKADVAKDISFMPGMDELFSLIKVKDLYESNDYDLIIVDCAPTGETLALLKFPELLSWYMEKLFPIGKVAMRVMRPVAKTFFKLQLPDKKDMNEIEKIYVNLCKLQELLKDRDICSIRLVTIPEKMVVEETKRSYMYLNLYNFNVDGLYINRILSDAVENEFFMEWKEIQGNYLEELTNVFQNIKTYRIKWYESDLNGLEYLERLCKDSLEDDEIFNVLKKDEGEVFKKLQEGYLLQVSVPFADKSQFQVYEGDREIIIKLGNFKRNIPLPEVISKYNLSKAKLEEGKLNITFSNK